MTTDAKKRLEAIEQLEDLGVGFMLATHDLEIRGAGELLGEGQSGQIQHIGFTLYSELLERAIKSLRSGESLEEPDLTAPHPEIDLHLPALLPDTYVADVHNRLILYKRISNTSTEGELDDIAVELIDRFGLLPEPTKHLLAVHQLRQIADPLGISKIDVTVGGGRIQFSNKTKIDPVRLIALIQSHPKVYRLQNTETLTFTATLETATERCEFVRDLLQRLQ